MSSNPKSTVDVSKFTREDGSVWYHITIEKAAKQYEFKILEGHPEIRYQMNSGVSIEHYFALSGAYIIISDRGTGANEVTLKNNHPEYAPSLEIIASLFDKVRIPAYDNLKSVSEGVYKVGIYHDARGAITHTKVIKTKIFPMLADIDANSTQEEMDAACEQALHYENLMPAVQKDKLDDFDYHWCKLLPKYRVESLRFVREELLTIAKDGTLKYRLDEIGKKDNVKEQNVKEQKVFFETAIKFDDPAIFVEAIDMVPGRYQKGHLTPEEQKHVNKMLHDCAKASALSVAQSLLDFGADPADKSGDDKYAAREALDLAMVAMISGDGESDKKFFDTAMVIGFFQAKLSLENPAIEILDPKSRKAFNKAVSEIFGQHILPLADFNPSGSSEEKLIIKNQCQFFISLTKAVLDNDLGQFNYFWGKLLPDYRVQKHVATVLLTQAKQGKLHNRLEEIAEGVNTIEEQKLLFELAVKHNDKDIFSNAVQLHKESFKTGKLTKQEQQYLNKLLFGCATAAAYNIVEPLLALGADPEVKSFHNMMPAQLAMDRAREIFAKTGDKNAAKDHFNTASFIAGFQISVKLKDKGLIENSPEWIEAHNQEANALLGGGISIEPPVDSAQPTSGGLEDAMREIKKVFKEKHRTEKDLVAAIQESFAKAGFIATPSDDDDDVAAGGLPAYSAHHPHHPAE